MATRLEIGAGTALVGAGIYQIHSVYSQHAGPLTDVRNAHPGSGEALQRLVDADCLAGGLTLLAGGALAIATGKLYPLGLALTAYALVVWYYHAALRAPSVNDGAESEGESS